MCKVSNKLKLCSCKTIDVERLKHYWILYRPNNDGHCIVGEMILPANIGEKADKYNSNTIRKNLNEGNCFDVEMQHQENDILELIFYYKQDPEKVALYWAGDFLSYAFAYKEGKWRKHEIEPFHQNLTRLQAGKITKPFPPAKFM